MPWDNLPESEWSKMDSCVADVQKTGKTEQAAIAICYTSLTGKAIDPHDLKIGASISKATMGKLQAAHDALAELGACPMDAQSPDATAPETGDAPSPEDALMPPGKGLIIYGGSAKALGNGRVGGYLVRFSSSNDPDLTGDYFTAKTAFGDHLQSPVLYQHGFDIKLGGRVIGTGKLTPDDIGVWIDAQLEMRDEYEKAVYELAQSGKLGWSSGTASHLVEREQTGKAAWIKSWPLGLDASLTPTPAEPRNSAVPIKSLVIGSPQEPVGVLDAAKNIVSNQSVQELNMTPEEIKALAVAAVEEYKRSEPATASAGIGRVEVKTDAADQPFANSGEFFMAVKNAAVNPMAESPKLRSLKAASGMSELVAADGGYLVPPEISAGIIQGMTSTGEILSRVSMTNVSGNSMTWNAIDETSRASSRWGGVVGYWLNEAGTKTASAPKFLQLELKLKKVIALAYATDELLADAPALQGWLTTSVPEELRFQTESAIIYGDGVGKPLGILASPALVAPARVDANKVQATDVVTMYSRRLGNGPFVWLINREVLPQILNLNSTYQYLFTPAGTWGDTPQARLLGYPLLESEYCSALGTAGDIILADLSQYQAIQKDGSRPPAPSGVEMASSIHVQFVTDQTCFRFVYRVDGAPIRSAALTPHKGSATLSPFVTLLATS